MKRSRTVALVAALLAALGVAVLAVTMMYSNVGRERSRQIALGIVRERVNGRVEIDRIEGNVLGRFALVGVRISDSAGNPLLAATRVRATLHRGPLLTRRIVMSNVVLEEPVVRLVKTPDEGWNYERIFHRAPGEKDTGRSFGDWITLRNVAVRRGALVIERPWSPDDSVSTINARRESERALSGDTRRRVDRAPWGLRETMDFRRIDARLSDALLADPERPDIVLRIDSLAVVAAPLRPPDVEVRHFAGTVRAGRGVVNIPEFVLRLPGTEGTGSLRYEREGNALRTIFHADTVTLADVRTVYPLLPDSAGGRMDFSLERHDGVTTYTLTNAELHAGSARVAGRLGVEVGPSTLAFRDGSLGLRDVPTSLIARIAPAARFPLPGVVSGSGTIAGEASRMEVDARGTFDPNAHPPFRWAARGGLGYRDALVTDRLHVRAEGVSASVVRALNGSVRMNGTYTAEATVTGTSAGWLRGPYRLTHRDSVTSFVTGTAGVAPRNGMQLQIGMRLEPVALRVASGWVPRPDLTGVARGSGRVWGTPRDLALWFDVGVSGGGAVRLDGRIVRPEGAAMRYEADVTVRQLNVQGVAPALPVSAVDGTVAVDGAGTTLATADATVTSHLELVTLDSTEFRDLALRATARGGVLTIDTLGVATAFGEASARGTLGLVEGRSGALVYRAAVHDLAGLSRWIATGDTGLVAARPAIRRRFARIRERQDSLRHAGDTASDPVTQLVAELRPPQPPRELPAPGVPPLPRDSIGGSIELSGMVRGNVKQLDVEGRARTPGLVWGGHLVGASDVSATWRDASSPHYDLRLNGNADSLRIAGFAFDSTNVALHHRRSEGDVELVVFPEDTAEYRLHASYALRSGEGELRVRSLRLRFDSTAWSATRPATISWKGHGVAVDSLEMRDRDGRGGARLFVNGALPDGALGRLNVAVDSLRLAPWLALLQSDFGVDGVATFNGTLDGTRTAPHISAELALAGARYRGAPFPDVRSKLDYQGRSLTLDGSMHRPADGELARIQGTLPLDLSLGDSVRVRRIDAPLEITVEGDSIPLAPFAELTEQLTTLDGRARGRVEIRGTWSEPRLEGAVAIAAPRVGLAGPGVTLLNVQGQLHMAGDTLVIDSLAGTSQGLVSARGHVLLTSLADPVFDVDVRATGARVLDNDRGELLADARLHVTGPLDTVSVGGNVTITRGVIFIPDPARLDIINTRDPVIFAMVDTATARRLDVAPPSEAIRNLRLNVGVSVQRRTFARSSDANVEIFGDVIVVIDPTTEGRPAVTGALYSEQGSYTFMGKRFVVTRGSVRFTGENDPNPVLRITATHEVRHAGRPPLDVKVILGGALRQPTVSLESEAQPTLSQSDLIAFLAFGQSSSSLLAFAGTGLEAGGAMGSSLAGNVASLASRQLASIALGALMDEAKTDLAGATRADVLNITPAELPPEVSLGALQTVLRGTEVEIGKYLDRRTFLVGRVRPSLVVPGATLERQLSDRLRMRAVFETRYRPSPPSLSSGLTPRTISVIGALLSWTFAW